MIKIEDFRMGGERRTAILALTTQNCDELDFASSP